MYRFSAFFSAILISRNESQGSPRPLYKSKKKISKVAFVSTLNLCLETPDTMQKTKIWSDHHVMRKRPKTAEIMQSLILLNFQQFFNVFSAQEDRIYV